MGEDMVWWQDYSQDGWAADILLPVLPCLLFSSSILVKEVKGQSMKEGKEKLCVWADMAEENNDSVKRR